MENQQIINMQNNNTIQNDKQKGKEMAQNFWEYFTTNHYHSWGARDNNIKIEKPDINNIKTQLGHLGKLAFLKQIINFIKKCTDEDIKKILINKEDFFSFLESLTNKEFFMKRMQTFIRPSNINAILGHKIIGPELFGGLTRSTIKEILNVRPFLLSQSKDTKITNRSPAFRKTIFNNEKNMNSILYTAIRAPNTENKQRNLQEIINLLCTYCSPLRLYLLVQDALKTPHANITEENKQFIITSLIKDNLIEGHQISDLFADEGATLEIQDIIDDNRQTISTTQAVEKLLLNNNFTEKRSWRFMQNIAADIAKE